MPFVGEITISGPHFEESEASQVTDAVAAAVEAGWQAPIAATSADDDDSEAAEDDSGSVLDYRVLGYPGGAIIIVVLEGGDLEQAVLAVSALARHLTTWSPGLLEYSVNKVSISKLDKPYDADNWLPPFADEEPAPRWPLAELFGGELQSLAAAYLLARAVRSLWDPAASSRPTTDAQDVVAGAIEHPWGRELVSALGPLLISAARLESDPDRDAKLVLHGAGDPELARDLLRRAQETGRESATDGWTDDRMRGYVLVERFMEDHDLRWNRVPPGLPRDQADRRSNQQLRELLWAGLRVLATLAHPVAHVSGPWQLLSELEDDEVVSILAEAEDERIEAAIDQDRDEIQGAAVAHALVWLAIIRPELLDTDEGGRLVEVGAHDVSALHQVIYHTLLMAGTGPVQEAVADQRVPSATRSPMTEFVRALAVTDRCDDDHQDDDYDDAVDAYEDMHHSLEAALAEGRDLTARVRGTLLVTGFSAALTPTDVNPQRGVTGYISTPRELAAELLTSPAEYAAIILSEESDEENIVRLNALALVARIDPAAAGEMAADFPDLAGEDPRMEPAAHSRALRWIEEACRVARDHGHKQGEYPHVECGSDAKAILAAVAAGEGVPAEWPVQRIVAAAAEATASVLRATSSLDAAKEVFARR
jgi:hypothetical protein